MLHPNGPSESPWLLTNGTSWTVMPDRTRADDNVHLCLEIHNPQPVGEPHQLDQAGGTGWVSIEGITQVFHGKDARRVSANLLIKDANEARDLADALLRAIGDIPATEDKGDAK